MMFRLTIGDKMRNYFRKLFKNKSIEDIPLFETCDIPCLKVPLNHEELMQKTAVCIYNDVIEDKFTSWEEITSFNESLRTKLILQDEEAID